MENAEVLWENGWLGSTHVILGLMEITVTFTKRPAKAHRRRPDDGQWALGWALSRLSLCPAPSGTRDKSEADM